MKSPGLRRVRISVFARLGYLPLLHILVEERVGMRRFLRDMLLSLSPPAPGGERKWHTCQAIAKIEMHPCLRHGLQRFGPIGFDPVALKPFIRFDLCHKALTPYTLNGIAIRGRTC